MKLDFIFTNHMVLQRNKPIKLWGEGSGIVKVTLNGQEQYSLCKYGKWEVVLDPMPAGGPYEICFKDSKEEIILSDVMIGDVWIAAGQSNMEHITALAVDGFDDCKKIGNNEKIRFFTVPRRLRDGDEFYNWHFESVCSKDTSWQLCTEETALHFSAIGFWFASELQHEKNIPVGIISCNYGGTNIETWIPKDRVFSNPKLSNLKKRYNDILGSLDLEKYNSEFEKTIRAKEEVCLAHDAIEMAREKGLYEFARKDGISWPEDIPFGPYHYKWFGLLYENMLKRIIPFTVIGVLWYQGESNVASFNNYFELFKALVDSWREKWGEKLPFLTVQIAPFKCYSEPEVCPKLIMQQLRAAKELENVFLVTTGDVGEWDNIHPSNKKVIAKRLFLAAQNVVYKEKTEYCGPIFRKAQVTENGSVIITFEHSEDGLCCKGDKVSEIFICCEDEIYIEAIAQIKGSQLIVYNPNVTAPKYVKMGFSNYSEINLYNKDGFIAAPFITPSLLS